jgi:hypothetical protein
MVKQLLLLFLLLFFVFKGFGQIETKKSQWLSLPFTDSISTYDLPWNQSYIKDINDDSVFNGFVRSIINDPFFQVKKKNSKIVINPEILLHANYETESSETFFTYGGGASFSYKRNNKLSFWTYFSAYQADASNRDSIRASNNLVPGVLASEFSKGLINVLDLRIRLAYKPNEYFQLETGIDNNFVGDGYHSILMGNKVAPYPFAMISTSFWKLDYNVQYHFLQDVSFPEISNKRKKYMTTHQLNFRATPKLHFYVWEAVVWKQEDSVVQRGYDMSYLNPIIFFRPVEFQLGSPSPDNVLIGFGFRYQLAKWLRFYGQGLLDEFYLKEIQAQNGWWANKFAFQLGVGSRFKIGDHRIGLLAEFNMARPFTYSHISSMQNYGHRLYPLAHPLGANFGELLFAGNWNYKQFGVIFKMASTALGTNGNEANQGQNIYQSYTERESEYGHSWLQGDLQKNISADIRADYIINKSFNLKISAGLRTYTDHGQYSIASQKYNELYIRLSTFLSSDMKRLYRTANLYE